MGQFCGGQGGVDDDADDGDDDDLGSASISTSSILGILKSSRKMLHCITLQGIDFPKSRVRIGPSDNREV